LNFGLKTVLQAGLLGGEPSLREYRMLNVLRVCRVEVRLHRGIAAMHGSVWDLICVVKILARNHTQHCHNRV